MKNLIKKYPILLVSLFTLALITIALLITALNLKDTSEIEIRVAPASATILIDGKQYQNGSYRIPSGTHQVKIEKSGFNTKEFSFNTASNNKLFTFLLESNGGYNWYLNHQEDAQLLTSIGDYEATLESEKYYNKYKISSVLPIIYANYDTDYNYTEFRIDGGSFTGCETNFCIKITDTTGGNYELALQKIRETGMSPDDYQILYEYIPIQPL